MNGKDFARIINPNKKPVYLGTTLSYPQKGESIQIARLTEMEGPDSCICSYVIIDSNKIFKVDKIYTRIYRVETETAVYIVLQV